MSALDLTAAVDAAARGMWGGTPDPFERPRAWDDLAPSLQHRVREAALLAVTAAAPLIEAAVREQVAREIEAATGRMILDQCRGNGARSDAMEYAFGRLGDHAARIALGDTP